MEGQGVSPWSFFFSFSTFTPTLILPGAFCSGRIQQTNETACVLFSFSRVENLLALMKQYFFGAVFRGRWLNCNGWIIFCSLMGFLGDWAERVRLTMCILSEDKGYLRKPTACYHTDM
jgi:hypothetical protein